MKISIPKKVYELDFDGELVTVRRPTVAEQDEYVERYTKAETPEEKEEVMYWLLTSVGFKREFLKTLDIDQFSQVSQLITTGEVKKN